MWPGTQIQQTILLQTGLMPLLSKAATTLLSQSCTWPTMSLRRLTIRRWRQTLTATALPTRWPFPTDTGASGFPAGIIHCFRPRSDFSATPRTWGRTLTGTAWPTRRPRSPVSGLFIPQPWATAFTNTPMAPLPARPWRRTLTATARPIQGCTGRRLATG